MLDLYLSPNDTPESKKTTHVARIIKIPYFLNPCLGSASEITLYSPEKGEFHTHRWSHLLETAQLGDFVEYKEWIENDDGQIVKKKGEYYRYHSRGGQLINPLAKKHKYIVRQVVENLSENARIDNLKKKYNEELARLQSVNKSLEEKHK